MEIHLYKVEKLFLYLSTATFGVHAIFICDVNLYFIMIILILFFKFRYMEMVN